MEVAGQWRREWAGTAEYGKITEGGVTRQVARAMEVLHASAPGTRVRVVRAAYHSTAGPGAPAASCLMHSSRRVISSGFNLLESPTTPPSKPLEISSTPFESSPEYNTDTANYKVTEPDDHDISEPSKWRSSTAGSSVRMPSEESSSADNASVIDLDARHHKISPRKYSFDSENSDILHFKKDHARVSLLLDAPAALSTLKYKSLLNGSNEWNSRRKSYSFEDTSPLSETVLQSNETLAMESSTDSGICKSNEIVNDVDDKYFDHKERVQEENFKDWLFKNRSPTFSKGNSVKPYRDHDVVERSFENTIALQSKGRVCITVPITMESDDDYQYKKTHASDENGRKVKKVEFCKTEVHFATETGKVNIIATDEKPPPSFDFRKRKSAFVPISGNFEKPITLFGENNKDFPAVRPNDLPIYSNNESGESDENTIATRSILKNKIPKPKPYLLGENMAFGSSDVINDKNEQQYVTSSVPTAVSLINKQLQSEKRYSDDAFKFITDVNKNNTYRTLSEGSTISEDIKNTSANSSVRKDKNEADSVKNKLKSYQMSPIQRRGKTRQLRDSDLTYFGIDRKPIYSEIKPIPENHQYESRGVEDLFQSVRLIQEVSRSNSACNSEAESEDTPEYQNIPIRHNFALIPTPKPRTKIDTKPSEIRILKPVIEQDVETDADTRRSRYRRMNETLITNRSLSAPPKTNARFNENFTIHTEDQCTNILKKETSPTRSRRNNRLFDERFNKKGNVQNMGRLSEERDPLYVNLREDKKSKVKSQRSDTNHRRSEQQHADTSDINLSKKVKEINKVKHELDSMERKRERGREKRVKERIRTTHHSRLETGNSSGLENNEDSNKKICTPRRTEKLATPEHSKGHQTTHVKQINIKKSSKENANSKNIDHQQQKEYRSQSSQRRSSSSPVVDSVNRKENGTRYLLVANEATRDNSQRNASEDKSSRRNNSRTRHKQDINSSENHRKSVKSNAKEIIVSERSPSADSDKHKHSKKKEYVINYDDKNGTVSSVCKINPAPASSKKIKLLKNNHVKDLKKHRAPEKNALLQFPEHQWNGHKYADKNWGTKMHVQRSCQLL